MKAATMAIVASAAVGGLIAGTMPVDRVDGVGVRNLATSTDPVSLYNSAQQKFAAGDIPGGLDALEQVLTLSPVDGEALALQAIWSDQLDDATTRAAALRRLGGVNPRLAATARNIIDGVDAAAQIVPDPAPKMVSGRVAIVILGFGLTAGGKMAPELVRRVTAGKAQAEATSTAPIVVSGGAPKAGVTEASAMRKWLISNGVDGSRITEEGRSGSTPANAQNTAAVLASQGVRDIILVTSPNHIRRAAADFAATGLKVVGAVTTQTGLAKYAKPLAREQQKGIRLEATRTAKIPASRQVGVPLPDNLPDTGPGLIVEYGGKLLDTVLNSGSATAN
ncbi:YdcF family protein [Gordonia sp. CPCC 206044]|uniref:YdcF family protein n=1 Tax=Gordonia sp. CPCC 206044 TaxID=3140793 RepID=UPI003AF3CC27